MTGISFMFDTLVSKFANFWVWLFHKLELVDYYQLSCHYSIRDYKRFYVVSPEIAVVLLTSCY